jgi:hypothetical protein|tara:strand:+ start:1353 stop:1580 length:228 start_codon:yes stop_codon:yes gene_type:complete
MENKTETTNIFDIRAIIEAIERAPLKSLRSWTPENRVTDSPNIQAGTNAGVYSSNRFLVTRDYLRLRFLSFGYTG